MGRATSLQRVGADGGGRQDARGCALPTLPTSTSEAGAFAKQLKSQGYRFVGPTNVYAFMQNVGVVNDHLHGCFRASDYLT